MPPKRTNPSETTSTSTPNKKSTARQQQGNFDGPEDLVFEDPYEDEVEDDPTDEKHVDAEMEDDTPTEGKKLTKNQKKRLKAKAAKAAATATAASSTPAPMEDEEEEVLADNEVIIKETGQVIEDDETTEKKEDVVKRVWRPGVDGFDEKTEQLTYNSSAYTCLHRMRVEWPCLSFDIIKDTLGVFRTKFPHTVYLAAGTQAADSKKNKVMILKISDIHKTIHDKDEDESESDSDDDDNPDDLDDDPILEEKSFAHPGGVNRLRIMPQRSNIVATWADTGKVHVWDIAQEITSLEQPGTNTTQQGQKKPLFSHKHSEEGFALAWSSVATGHLVSGDCSKHIYGWTPKEDGTFTISAPYKGHATSVEDLQWSPTEANVFASCSADKTIRIWDSRVYEKSQLWVAAHRQDVNVISWNPNGVAAHLLASGSDDGIIKVWDLRSFKSNSPAASFTWHKQPITSVEWHPTQESVVAASSEDNTLTVWDLGLEADEEAGTGAQTVDAIPPQLYFVHQGQRNIKEIHFHSQIPSMIISTAEDGFNLFKPQNME